MSGPCSLHSCCECQKQNWVAAGFNYGCYQQVPSGDQGGCSGLQLWTQTDVPIPTWNLLTSTDDASTHPVHVPGAGVRCGQGQDVPSCPAQCRSWRNRLPTDQIPSLCTHLSMGSYSVFWFISHWDNLPQWSY